MNRDSGDFSPAIHIHSGVPAVKWVRRMGVLILLCSACFCSMAAESSRVALVRCPGDGIQPQAVTDRRGTVHLIYYRGDPKHGDLFYVRHEPEQTSFSKPIPVNTRAGSAIAMGTIRGPQLALGRNGWVHVAWNGPAPENGSYMEAPMLYTRLNDAGTAFEPERDVITRARGLDGGGSVAADPQGNVLVFWHAPKPGNTNGEAGRALFVARSTNDGRTFAPEALATDKPTGACGCCGMKAWADDHGNVFALYRSASEQVNRDEILLISRDQGLHFDTALVHPWKVATCPMSSASFSDTAAGLLAAWETEGNVYFAHINSNSLEVSKPFSPSGPARRKYPVAVGNAGGDVLLAWTEGTGWGKGGSVVWQLYDKNGQPLAEHGQRDGVPTWSLITALAKSDGGFVIIY